MEKKFTRGEWRVFGPVTNTGGRGYSNDEIAINCISGDDRGFEIARASDIWNDVEKEANARLISASPDLFEALQAFVTAGAGPNEAMQQAKRAIAKALGNELE